MRRERGILWCGLSWEGVPSSGLWNGESGHSSSLWGGGDQCGALCEPGRRCQPGRALVSLGEGCGWEVLQTSQTVNIQRTQCITLLLPLLLTGRTQCGVGTWPADTVFLKTVKAYQPIVLFLLPLVKCCITQSDFSISLERDGHSNVHISTVSFPQGLTGFSHCCQAHISGENILHPSLVGQCGLNVFAIVTQWYITDQFDGLHLYTINPKDVLEWEVHPLRSMPLNSSLMRVSIALGYRRQRSPILWAPSVNWGPLISSHALPILHTVYYFPPSGWSLTFKNTGLGQWKASSDYPLPGSNPALFWQGFLPWWPPHQWGVSVKPAPIRAGLSESWWTQELVENGVYFQSGKEPCNKVYTI